MKCNEFERRLQRELDRGREPRDSAALARHALRCGSCARTLQLYDALWDGIDMLEVPEPSADFSRRTVQAVVAAAAADAPSGRASLSPWQMRLAAVIAVMAAAILIVVFLPPWNRVAPPRGGGSAETVAARSGDASRGDASRGNGPLRSGALSIVDASPRKGSTTENREKLPTTLDSATADGARPVDADAAASGTVSMPPAYRDVIHGLTARLSDVPLEEIKNAGVAEGLRPLTSPFSAAISLLRKTLAVGGEPKPDAPQAHSPEREPQRDFFRERNVA